MEPMNCEVAREKYWSELNDSERLERTRSEVNRLRSRVSDLTELFYKLSTNFTHHAHNGEKVMVSVSDPQNPCVPPSVQYRIQRPEEEEVYF